MNPSGRFLAPFFGAVARPILRFLNLEAASGILLLAAAAGALFWANGSGGSYEGAFEVRILGATVREVINDGLMTLFFFLVGMEIKRELLFGELRTVGRAALPAVAAIGGMVVPALLYLAFNGSGPARRGWGVPMATDIAFCIGVLTLLRSRVPQGLLVFLTALAIFDDIGGILAIALFYGHGLHLAWLGLAVAVIGVLIVGRRRNPDAAFYLLLGALLWFALHRGGIHATLAGVVAGLSVRGGERLGRFIERLHPAVAFLIMPLFALANCGVSLRAIRFADLTAGVTLGIACGLVAGKLSGIFIFTVAAVRLRLAPMPGDASATKVLGASAVGGIGFTVALFIAALAFSEEPRLLVQAKLGILGGSLLAGAIGAAILLATPPATSPDPPSTAAR